jgi:hypothetical protein|nr:hypothetical protein 18 [Alphaproteobacteria bacterium]
MYLTMVMVCFIGASECVRFEDTTGLKETKEDCYERAIEMVANIQSIPQYIPPPYTISYKCALGDAT